MKGKPVIHRNGTFPSILDALDFFDPEGGVAHVIQKQLKLFFECLTDFTGQGVVLFSKSIAETVRPYSSNHFKPSSAV
jgi:hypothetical protein